MKKRIRPIKTMMILSVVLVLGTLGLYSAFSGNLEPTAAPAPTMYTLEEIYNYRVWRMTGLTFVDHPDNTRFAVCEFDTPGTGDDLVLDKDTGLIWARNADLLGGDQDAYDAVIETRALDLGDRMGWRLPSIEELSSLIDVSVAGSPKLPTGHPFVNVQSGDYWTDTTLYMAMGGSTYGLNIEEASVTELDGEGEDTAYVWPVWGGKSVGS